MSEIRSPLDDIRDLTTHLRGPNVSALAAARTRVQRADAGDGLGKIGEIALWLAAWSGREPTISRPLAAVFASEHGVAAHGVDHRSAAFTQAMVEHCAAGGAAISQICASNDIGLKVFDLALGMPTGDITVESALDERGCAATIAFGMESVAGGIDLACLGTLGVGGSTAAGAVCAALHGREGASWVVDAGSDVGRRSAAAIDAALAAHEGRLGDPLDVLRHVGGREIAATVGAIIAARVESIPVIIEGDAAVAAAAILHQLDATALDHCRLAEAATPLQRRIAGILRLAPLIDLGLDLGAAAAAVPLLRTAATCLANVRPLPDLSA